MALNGMLTDRGKELHAEAVRALRHSAPNQPDDPLKHIQPPWWSMLDVRFRQTKHELSWRNRMREYWWRFSTGRIHFIVSLILVAWILALFVLPLLRARVESAQTWVIWATATAERGSKILALIITIWGIFTGFCRSLWSGSAKAARSYMDLTHDPMNDIKKRFETYVRRLGRKRVVVFIDDLDRCKSSYVVELLEGIQTLFRSAPVIFIVAADRQWRNACYEEVYTNLKPSISEPGERTRHVLMPFAHLLEPNPRAMKRLVNACNVNRVLSTLAYVDIKTEPLILWTILSMRWPRLAEYLKDTQRRSTRSREGKSMLLPMRPCESYARAGRSRTS
jgi:hypothetical protein